MQEIYQFYTLKEHLTDVESHIYKDILENKSKNKPKPFGLNEFLSITCAVKKVCIITFLSWSNYEYFSVSASQHCNKANVKLYPLALCEIDIHKPGHTYFHTLTFFLPQISEAVNREGKKGSLQTASDQWCRK